jgi:hypothetical protein
MLFEPRPPYGILQSHAIDFATMQRLRRFAQVWDSFWNRGDLPAGMRLLWRGGSPFERTLAFTDWLFAQAGRVHSVSLENRARYLAQHLIDVRGESHDQVCELIEADFASNGRRAPRLARQLQRAEQSEREQPPERQRRHLGARGAMSTS